LVVALSYTIKHARLCIDESGNGVARAFAHTYFYDE
jgi:hypothetical protein